MIRPAPEPLRPHWLYSPDRETEARVQDARHRFPALYSGGLERTRALLARLGDPHLSLPPVIHAAGTNGKGSVLAFAEAAFTAGGKSVHKYISPHLVRFEERITLGGRRLEGDAFARLYDETARATGGLTVSFFEFFTALFFLGAARAAADAVLLETGMGGRLDATNVIAQNACAVLTRISRDHTAILGDSIAAIAGEKAGIIKRGCPVVIAPQQDDDATQVFKAAAAALDAPVAAWDLRETPDGILFNGRPLPRPALLGRHQIDNAGAALAALDAAGFGDLPKAAALTQAVWPGRWQQVAAGRLAALLPAGWELWIDGAHNDSGAAALLRQLDDWGNDKPPLLLTAFKDKKDLAAFYAPLAGRFAATVTVDIAGDAPMIAGDRLAAALCALGHAARHAPSLETAIGSLCFSSAAPHRIIVAGSLYLAGDVLRINGA